MNSSTNRIIVLGITSSLAGSLLCRFPETSHVYGFVRALNGDDHLTTLKKEYRQTLRENKQINLVDYDGTDENLIERLTGMLRGDGPDIPTKVLYLSTKVSMNVLNALSDYDNVQTLTIGSGAVTDWGNQREGFDIVDFAQNEGTRGFASYIEGKARAERVSTVTVHPGFYLPEEDAPFTWSGLHLDSCEQIFAREFNPEFKWGGKGKAKFVTPVADLSDLIFKWVSDDTLSSVRGGYSFGTNRVYQRWELREAAGFTDVPDSIKEKFPVDTEERYFRNMLKTFNAFGKRCSSVESAAKSARKWVESNSEQYKRLRQ